MSKINSIRMPFYASSVYDGVLGILLLFFSEPILKLFNIVPPNHSGYLQFPALLLIVFSVMYLQIAKDPLKNVNLVPYGILLKVSYCLVVCWHWIFSSVPDMWKPLALFDVIFLILFVQSYLKMKKELGDT